MLPTYLQKTYQEMSPQIKRSFTGRTRTFIQRVSFSSFLFCVPRNPLSREIAPCRNWRERKISIKTVSWGSPGMYCFVEDIHSRVCSRDTCKRELVFCSDPESEKRKKNLFLEFHELFCLSFFSGVGRKSQNIILYAYERGRI